MKSKITKILGAVLALVLISSMMAFALPTSANPYTPLTPRANMWTNFVPTAANLGAYFYDANINKVGPIAKAINGDLYAYVAGATATGVTAADAPKYHEIFKSTDGGRTWTYSRLPARYWGQAAVEIICSDLSEDVVYVADSYYVYKSIDGGLTFMRLAENSLETMLLGVCGPAIEPCNYPSPAITCMDVGYNSAGDAFVYIGVMYTDNLAPSAGEPTILYINEGGYPAQWTDLQLHCYRAPAGGNGDYWALSIGVAPDFATSKKTYAVVTNDDDEIAGTTRTWVVYSVGVTCDWIAVAELLWDCQAANQFQARWASRFAFPDDFATTKTMFVGVAGTLTGCATYGVGGDVYRVVDSIPAQAALDLNVNPGLGGCTGYHANICSLDMIGSTDSGQLIAGALDVYQYQAPIDVYYSNDAGWTWSRSAKDPTGEEETYVLFYNGSAVAATKGCDCAFSMSCGDVVGQYWNQLSLIARGIAQVLDMSFGPSYETGVKTMFVLTQATDNADAFSLTNASTDCTDAIATVLCNAGSATVTEINDVGATGITISDSSLTAGETATITLPDFGDAVKVTATATTNVTVTQTNATVVYAELRDCDEDMCGGIAPTTFDMDNATEIRSLLRYDGSYWERVHSSRFCFQTGTAAATWMNTPLYTWVEVSPDFDDTSCVYMCNTDHFLTRTLDAGCSWRALSYPCVATAISAWIVVDENTVLTGGAAANAGIVFRTKTAGSKPWDAFLVRDCLNIAATDGVDFDFAPNVATSEDLLYGDDTGYVYFSSDLGATWSECKDFITGAFNPGTGINTYVVFDPGYATNNLIYAAAGDEVGRFVVSQTAASQCLGDWLYLSDHTGSACDTFNLCLASGIAIDGDPTLYVSDAGTAGDEECEASVGGTIAVRYSCSIEDAVYNDLCTCDITIDEDIDCSCFDDGELLVIIAYNLYCTGTGNIKGEITLEGYESGCIVTIEIDQALPATCEDCGPETAAFEVISSNLIADVSEEGAAACPSGVWRTVNPQGLIIEASGVNLVEWEFLHYGYPATWCLRHPTVGFGVYSDDLWLTHTATSKVIWALDSGHPTWIAAWDDPLATEVVQLAPADAAVLATTTAATLQWEALDAATTYQIRVYEACPECLNPLEMKELTTSPYTVSAPTTCLTITTLTCGTQYYWKVRVACDSPQVSKWSELHSFTTALCAIFDLCSPICGASDIIPTTNFSWDAVVGATGYEVQIVAASADGTADFTGATTYTSDVNALASIPGLEYSTVYFWRVRAVKDSVPSAWSTCLFTIMDEPEECPPAITPVTIVTEEITPMWIWVIIGIGGALTIVVIILIVTTRRTS